MQAVRRADARARGLKRYFTGIPCPHGHMCERLVSNAMCVECGPIFRKRWYENDVERARKLHREWRAKRRDEALKSQRNRYIENRREELDRARKYRTENSEKVRISSQKSYRRSCARRQKIEDAIAVLQAEMPDLLKEFGL